MEPEPTIIEAAIAIGIIIFAGIVSLGIASGLEDWLSQKKSSGGYQPKGKPLGNIKPPKGGTAAKREETWN